jgi:hypothetical protein
MADGCHTFAKYKKNKTAQCTKRSFSISSATKTGIRTVNADA